MKYDDARELIEDGDLVSIRTAHGLFGRATQFFTGRVYTHNGIAVWLDGGLWMVEINGGRNHAVPMSQLIVDDFDVFRAPDGLDRAAIRKAALESIRVRVPYGYAATVAIGLLEFLGINKFVHWRKILVCSGYAVAIYEAAGWPEHSRIISPGKLSELLEYKLSVRTTKGGV